MTNERASSRTVQQSRTSRKETPSCEKLKGEMLLNIFRRLLLYLAKHMDNISGTSFSFRRSCSGKYYPQTPLLLVLRVCLEEQKHVVTSKNKHGNTVATVG